VKQDVVALHSLFFDGEMFDSLDNYLWNRRVHALAYRGEPWTKGHEHQKAYSLAELATEAIADIRRRAAAPVHLLGSSMGAYVALMVAARVPELVASCALLGATADREDRPDLFADFETRLRLSSAVERADLIADTMFAPTFRERNSVAFEHWRGKFELLDRAVADVAHQVFSRESLWPYVSRLRCPLLLIAGGADVVKPPVGFARIADRIHGTALEVIPDAGHTPLLERPDLVLPLLATWWSDKP
jgi:3-oxoadipate enol-lactonase